MFLNSRNGVLIILCLVCFAGDIHASEDTIGIHGIRSAGLQLPNGSPLNGSGIGIGQVEPFRPGDPTRPNGTLFDTTGNLINSSVDPAEVFFTQFANPGVPSNSFTFAPNVNGTIVPGIPQNVEIDEHSLQVAGVMISTDTRPAGIPNSVGVSPGADLFSIGNEATSQGADALSAQHVALANSGSVRAINMSFRTGANDFPWCEGMPIPDPPQIPDVGRKHMTEWETSVLSLLDRVFGRASTTFERFNNKVCNPPSGYNDNYAQYFEQLHAVFLSSKSDYEGGYIFDVRNLVHAEVFSNELEQAEHFLTSGYKVASAIITGVVLETTIKKICSQHEISLTDHKGKFIATDTLITNLRKQTVYNEAEAKQLRAWMDLRNEAAHGKRKDDDLELGEISRMIQGVNDFIARHMS